MSGSAAQDRGRQLLVSAFAEQWRILALGAVVSLCWTTARVAIPTLISRAVDEAVVGGEPVWPRVWPIALAGAVAAVFTGLRRLSAFTASRRVEQRFRQRIFDHLQALDAWFHDQTSAGELLSRANTDLQQFQNVVTLAPVSIGNTMVVIVVVIVLFTSQPVLAVLALAGLPAVNVLGRRFSQRLHPEVLAVQQESAELAAVVEESVAGIRVIKGFGAEDRQRSLLAVEAEGVRARSLAAARIRARYLPAIELMPNLGLVLVLGYGGWLVLNDRLSIGSLVAFNLYVVMLIQPLRMLGMVVAMWQRSVAAGGRIAAVLDALPAVTDPVKPVALPPGGGTLRFEQVSFSYGDLPVLQDLDLVVEAGESVAIVGATGSGKSTLARLVPRFYDVTSGRLSLDGVVVSDLKLASLRRSVATVFEDTFLFSGTVADNIGFGLDDPDPAVIANAARLAGAADFIEDLPDGYQTQLGERGLSLSGGQRQRLAIARAVATDPRVLILDDATSAVDPAKEHEIRAAMAEVMANRTTLVIAHRPSAISLADRVVLLDEGRIVDQGRHEELLVRSDRYREILAAVGPTGIS